MPTPLLRALFDRYDVDVSWLISGKGKRYNEQKLPSRNRQAFLASISF